MTDQEAFDQEVRSDTGFDLLRRKQLRRREQEMCRSCVRGIQMLARSLSCNPLTFSSMQGKDSAQAAQPDRQLKHKRHISDA